MHDPKTDNEVQRFEKEVQQKMGELEFSPSAAVWANVERTVRKEKRRRLPVFWLFFLPALLLIGAAGIYYYGGQPEHPGTTPTAKNNPDLSVAQRPATTSSHTTPPATSPSPEPSADQPATSLTSSPSSHSTSSTVPSPAAVANHTTQLAATRPGTQPNSSQTAASRPQGTTAPGSARSSAPDETSPFAGTSTADKTPAPARPSQPQPANTAGVPGLTGDETLIQGAKINFHPVSGINTPKVSAAPLTTATAKAAVPTKTQLSPKRPWEAGFAGGIGVSSLHDALFKQSPSSLNDSRNFSAPAPVTGPVSQSGSAAQNYTSKIQSDLAFWAGVFLQKPLSKDLSVSVGLNLHYYSTKVYTGDKITSTTPSSYNNYSYLLSSAAAAGPGQTYPYYTTGDKQVFINRYYFLEIPGSIQWQITHSRVMPLFWEGGFSLAYLVSSNALYYNTHAGVFYKDGAVTNKTQFNLSTALMVGIPFKGVNLQVGPQVQYGLTSLLNTGDGGQHFFYGGLKLVVFPGKAHKGGKHRFRIQEQ